MKIFISLILLALCLSFGKNLKNNEFLINVEEYEVFEIDNITKDTIDVKIISKFLDKKRTLFSENFCKTISVTYIGTNNEFHMVISTVVFNLETKEYFVPKVYVFDVNENEKKMEPIGEFGTMDSPVVSWSPVSNEAYGKEFNIILTWRKK